MKFVVTSDLSVLFEVLTCAVKAVCYGNEFEKHHANHEQVEHIRRQVIDIRGPAKQLRLDGVKRGADAKKGSIVLY